MGLHKKKWRILWKCCGIAQIGLIILFIKQSGDILDEFKGLLDLPHLR